MHWLTAFTAVLSFAKELMKYMREKNACKKEAATDMKLFAKAMKKARKEGDTSDLEERFKRLTVLGRGDELPHPGEAVESEIVQAARGESNKRK